MGASFAFSILYNMTLAPIEVELICFAIFTIDKFFFLNNFSRKKAIESLRC